MLNPYTYEGENLKYHISTGDWITGLMFDFSLTNSFINLIGLIYFLYNRNFILSTFCLLIMLLATSNANIILLLVVIISILIFDKRKLNKTMALCFLGISVVFLAKISPDNLDYTIKTVNRRTISQTTINYQNTSSEKKEMIKKNQKETIIRYVSLKRKKQKKDSLFFTRPQSDRIIKATMASITKKKSEKEKPFVNNAVDIRHKKLLAYVRNVYQDSLTRSNNFTKKELPGRIISFMETINYTLSGIRNFLVGSGAGLFSSKLAFKASGIGEFGKYFNQHNYVSNDFKNNHLKIYSYYFLQSRDKHSVTNTPFSVYNQLLGEYGIIGILLFIVCYICYYTKYFKHLTYGKIILPLCVIFIATDYWFEHLSVLIVFEIMMYLDILEKSEKQKLDVSKL